MVDGIAGLHADPYLVAVDSGDGHVREPHALAGRDGAVVDLVDAGDHEAVGLIRIRHGRLAVDVVGNPVAVGVTRAAASAATAAADERAGRVESGDALARRARRAGERERAGGTALARRAVGARRPVRALRAGGTCRTGGPGRALRSGGTGRSGAPFGPAGPVAPVAPFGPAGPAGPAGPVAPFGPFSFHEIAVSPDRHDCRDGSITRSTPVRLP